MIEATSVQRLRKKLRPLVVAARNLAMGGMLGFCRGPIPQFDASTPTDTAVQTDASADGAPPADGASTGDN